MRFKPLPTQQRISRALCYNALTGQVETVGTRARISTNRDGYATFFMHGEHFMLHRLIWKLQTGEDPGMIDHINGNRTDNRWENLRECTQGLHSNMQNIRCAHQDSRTGLLGVSIDPRPGGRYYARLMVRGKQHNLGAYTTAEEAHQVYLSAKKHLHEFGKLDGNPALVATAYQKKPRRQNKTGVAGVWPRYNGRFQTKICVDGKTIHLGTFRTVEEASTAYQEARNRYRPRLALNSAGLQ